MLTICLITGGICFILSQLAIDLLLGVKLGDNYLNTYYAKLKGEDTKEKKSSTRHKEKEPLQINRKTYLLYSLPAVAIMFVCCLIFFRNVGTSSAISLLGFLYPKYMAKTRLKRRRELLNIQLREAMASISNSLKAGNSLQTSLERCLEDMGRLLKNKTEKPIIDELEKVIYDIQIGKTLEEALISFRDRLKMEDIDTFVNAAIITKEKGGNLTEVMSNVSESISDKIQIKREIMTLTAGKRSEAKLLTFVPVILVLALSVLSPSYMKPMYETTLGKIMMIVGTALLAVNYFLGKRIIDIKV